METLIIIDTAFLLATGNRRHRYREDYTRNSVTRAEGLDRRVLEAISLARPGFGRFSLSA